MKYVALPEELFNATVNAVGSLPANNVRRLLNDIEATARTVDVNDPQPIVEDTEIVTAEQKKAAEEADKKGK